MINLFNFSESTCFYQFYGFASSFDVSLATETASGSSVVT